MPRVCRFAYRFLFFFPGITDPLLLGALLTDPRGGLEFGRPAPRLPGGRRGKGSGIAEWEMAEGRGERVMVGRGGSGTLQTPMQQHFETNFLIFGEFTLMTDLMVFDFTAEFRVDEHGGRASVVCLRVALSGLY
jgi:hypothetical protein